jgi:flagellin
MTIVALGAARAMEKLSSGFRINRAGDDAAGLSISEKMRAQVSGYAMMSRNASDTVSLIQTADGALSESQSILQRMRELAVQSSNATYTDADRRELQSEVKQLSSELNRIGNSAEFNTKKLLDGGATGVSDEVREMLRIDPAGAGAGEIDVSTQLGASAAIEAIDAALQEVSHQRSELGAVQNGLEHTVRSLDIAGENTQAAESRIRDADMALEVMHITRDRIMGQASLAMLAQANQRPQGVSALLG